MKKHLNLLFLGCLLAFYSSAQRTCGTTTVDNRLMHTDAQYRANRERLAAAHRSFSADFPGLKLQAAVIPVVVHILYTGAKDSIPKTQVASQLFVLNADYSSGNPDITRVPFEFKGLIARTTGIQFLMASATPFGKPTDGIEYRKTSVTEFRTDDKVKFRESGGLDAWPRDKYLNIWVCNLSEGLLGYAQFPGGEADTDGIVIQYSAFGNGGTALFPFDKGRTASHEVGHWLDLYHTWGDNTDCSGDDRVEDTPSQQSPNFHCPPFPHVTCNNAPYGELFVNFMDFVDDACMVMFTQGQANRIQSTLVSGRTAFWNGATPAARAKAKARNAGVIDY